MLVVHTSYLSLVAEKTRKRQENYLFNLIFYGIRSLGSMRKCKTEKHS